MKMGLFIIGSIFKHSCPIKIFKKADSLIVAIDWADIEYYMLSFGLFTNYFHPDFHRTVMIFNQGFFKTSESNPFLSLSSAAIAWRALR